MFSASLFESVFNRDGEICAGTAVRQLLVLEVAQDLIALLLGE